MRYLKGTTPFNLACAIISDCAYFVTCDDRIIKRSELLDLHMLVCNPRRIYTKGGKR